MRIDRVALTNFMSHEHTDIVFDKTNPIIVVGENGAGKSSLIKDSITWSLFGKARSSVDELIRENADEMIATIEFSVGKILYVVTRIRERNKKTRLLFDEWYENKINSLAGATIAETEKKIQEILGFTYETFISTACIEQGKANYFSALTPKEAKRVLMQILRLDCYEIYSQKTKQKITRLENELASNEQSLVEWRKSTIDTQTLNTHVVMSKEQIKELTDEKADLLHKQYLLEQQQNIIADNRLDAGKNDGRLKLYYKQLIELRGRLQEKYTKLHSSGTSCPLCETSLTEENLQRIETKMTDKIAWCDLRIAKTEQEIIELETKRHALVESGQILTNETSKLQTRIERINLTLRDMEAKRGALDEKQRQVDDAQTRIEQLEQKQELLKVSLQRYLVLDKAFDSNGIPTLIIENTLSEIEFNINQILAILCSVPMRVIFETQKSLKTGGLGDTLTIRVVSLTNTRVYDNLSSGEQFRVDLAIRIALSQILARRNSFKCATLIIDEGFGSLDAIGRQRFVELSSAIKQQFERVIIITHTDVAEMYPNAITVEKHDGISRLLVASV